MKSVWFLGVCVMTCCASAQTTLEFDPMQGWASAGGVGGGRAAYFTCDETITLTGAGFYCDMNPGLYEVQIYQGAGEFAAPGPLLHSVTVSLGGIGQTWQDAAISYTLNAGQDYLLHFRSADPNLSVANSYQRFFWGDDPGEDLDLGVVTIRDGRAGYDASNYSNVAFPRMRIEYVDTTCYADCDQSGSLNIFDYICFGNEYSAGSSYADCDGSGSLNIFDYICFGNEYVNGCP
ncbi:MAG: hypothetical protein H6815_05425 [Phycisphaeraceae bacterium]|nr:hypothetical protein [Phycisphaerales bacterium]MCB9859878.1 hypothetical protein [Phycisphaeraceae bacterium]